MRLSVLVVASVLAAGMLPTVSIADPAQTGDTPQATTSDLDQVVCRKTPPPVGTRLGGGRECHTQREWNDRQEQAQKAVRDSQLRGGTGGMPGG